ncbi:hypothetical protein IHE45_19G182000 [Dioscorea alata]|uniref:Uncharacterized protein n=1 Tax=Dioscorea alata TaxID=55571 RepID=A0ACB7U4B3_DIOAL|nr:hypothetical protein IHE45_19G182000 [Dioscorea alata]
MEISSSASHGLCLSRSLLSRPSHTAATTTLSILTASSTVRSNPYRSASAPRSLTRRKRLRTRRGSMDGGDEEQGLSGDDGPFGGGCNGGGSGWGFGGGSGRPDWEDESGSSSWSSSSSDPAFDFLYEVVCWIALSNCAHFAFRKVGRFLKEKAVPLMC